MDRRRILLVVAVVVALAGTAMVYLYVRGADARANDRFKTANALVAVAPIEAGESIDDAATNGKLALQPVPQDYLLPNYQTSVEALSGSKATVAILPGEQIVSDKFSTEGATPTGLAIPKGMLAISVSLTDTGRVAGFVNPGTEVAIFLNGADPASGQNFSRLLLEKVEVIAVGSTTTTQTTTTTAEGVETTEQLPRTLMTLALTQEDAEKVMASQSTGELAFAVLTEDSKVNPGPGVSAADLFQ